MDHRISKTGFVTGWQCLKAIWLRTHRKDLIPDVTEEQQAKFDMGKEVDILSRDLKPGGILCYDATVDSLDAGISRTRQLVKEGVEVLYEPVVVQDGALIIGDILFREGNGWALWEVKSSGELKKEHFYDVAYQVMVLRDAGWKIEDAAVVIADKTYVRGEEIDVSGLFHIESVYDRVIAMQEEVRRLWKAQLEVLSRREHQPEVSIGPQCKSPHKCDFKSMCWAHLPFPSVLNVSRISKKGFALHDQGIVEIKDIPEGFPLTSNQQIEVDSTVRNKPHIDTDSIRNFLEEISYPVGFMDFETIDNAIPIYVGSRPFQKIPFQFSMHIAASPSDLSSDDLPHHEFLGEPEEDPREAFIDQLIEVSSGLSSILVYNMSFEDGRLKELKEAFPAKSTAIQSIRDKLIDLYDPFKNHWYYHPDMNGSASIKSVLPVFAPELSYQHLAISDGKAAGRAYLRLNAESSAQERDRVRQALLAYCRLDTWGMVVLLRGLRELVSVG